MESPHQRPSVTRKCKTRERAKGSWCECSRVKQALGSIDGVQDSRRSEWQISTIRVCLSHPSVRGNIKRCYRLTVHCKARQERSVVKDVKASVSIRITPMLRIPIVTRVRSRTPNSLHQTTPTPSHRVEESMPQYRVPSSPLPENTRVWAFLYGIPRTNRRRWLP